MRRIKEITRQQLRLTPSVTVSKLTFNEVIGGRESIYRTNLLEAISKDLVVTILASDKYMLTQFKKQAKKLNFRLLFAIDGENLHIKPIKLDGDLKRLLLSTREPRTINELIAYKFQLNLKEVLEEQLKKGLLLKSQNGNHVDVYKTTEKGLSVLID